MSNGLLEKRFGEIGARARVLPRDARRGGMRVSLDVVKDKRGEVFTVMLADGVYAQVVNVDAAGRHLLLHVKDSLDRSASKFLCGHDERHWFVAAVPEGAGGVTTVAAAKEALLPDGLRGSVAVKGLARKKRHARRNQAFKRQGEWFFTPDGGVDPPEHLVHHNEPITRGRGKPHIVEFLYRTSGETVYVGGGKTVSAAEFAAMSSLERRKRLWVARTVVEAVWARGRVRHSDHATITLDGWHRVEMNTEQRSRAMAHVAFID